MPNTIEELSSNLGSLNISSRETKNDVMKKTFREVSKAAASYGEKEPHTASVKKISSNDEDSDNDDDEDSDEDEGNFVNDEDSDNEGGQFVNDDDSDDEEIKEVTAKCGKDQKPKTQNRDSARPYNVPNRLGAVNLHESAQSESAAARFFDERQYTNALEWLIDAKNRHFPENAIIVQLEKLKNSVDQNSPNKYSEFRRIFCQPNHEEVTVLFYAAIHNLMRTTEYLVKEIYQNGFPSPHQAKAYFNKQDPAGNTLLHEMAFVGDSVASTMGKLFEFRFPDAKHTLFDYRIKNLSQQSPIHYSIENCFGATPQYQMIDLFYTVDKDILKVLDRKGKNLLFCFINSCQKAYPIHGNVDSGGLETVKKYLNILFRYPETSGHGCRELVNGLHQHMEPTVWNTIDSWLRAAKIEDDQIKPEDDDCQIIYSGTTKLLVEKKPNQEKQTPVVLVPREEKKQQTPVQEEDSMDSGDLIPVFVQQRSLEAMKEEPYKKGGNKSKGSSRKTSRHSSNDEGYPTSASTTPGTSPHHASTSGKTYFEINESSTKQSSTIPTTIPLFVEDISNGGPVVQLNHRSGDKIYSKPVTSPSTPTFKHIVPNPHKMALKPTSYVKMSIAPNPQSHITPSPSSFSQSSPSPGMHSQMSPAYSTYSQMSPTSSTHSQMSPPQSAYSHMSPSPNIYSPVSQFPSIYSQPSQSPSTYSQMSQCPSTYSQMSPPPSTYSQMSPPPSTYSQMSPPSSTYSQMSASPDAFSPSSGAYEMLKLLPETACPDASTVLDAINETNHSATTSATKYHSLSHAEQVRNLEAGKQIDLVLNVTENQIIQVDASTLDQGTMLIDYPSLSQFEGQTTTTGQPDQTNELEGILTTQDFDDYLAGVLNSSKTEAEVEDKMMPDMDLLLNTPQVEKPAFSFPTA